MIASFADRGSEDVFDGATTRAARATCPAQLWPVARRKLTQINRVRDVGELAIPPGNRLERLGGDRKGQYSCFNWETGDADNVEITDYH